MADVKADNKENEETLEDLLNSNAFTQSTPKQRMKLLQAKKSVLEEKINNLLLQIPQEFRNVKKKPHYVDMQGFPRSDIDIWQISTVRKDVVPLQNDHTKLMNIIEKTLIEIFAQNKKDAEKKKEEEEAKKQGQENDNQKEKEKNKDKDKDKDKGKQIQGQNENNENVEKKEDKKKEISPYALKPFYLVDKIFAGSPAQDAGLKSGDLVIQFGSMVNENKSPQLLQEIVKSSINKPIPVTIKRNPEGILGLSLVPKQWSGRGLLGCHLSPYQGR